MFAAKHNFGLVDAIRPEALGVPGKRIFRILVDGPSSAAATLWVEKEQIYGLSMAMKKMLEVSEGPEAEKDLEADFPLLTDPSALRAGSLRALEFKVGRLGLAYGPGEHLIVFFHDAGEEPGRGEDDEEGEEPEEAGPPPTLQVCLKRGQAEAFVRESLEVTASGRGTDALSRSALVASGKVDPGRNGHFKH